MIKMSVCHQNRVRLCRETMDSIVNAGGVRLDASAKAHAQEVHPRKIRIDKQCVSFEFKLITIRAEISHANAVTRLAGNICNHEVPIGVESTGESLRSKPEKKEKTAHPTTNSANVTDVEEEAANFHGAYVSL
jgi:hypothetical protein